MERVKKRGKRTKKYEVGDGIKKLFYKNKVEQKKKKIEKKKSIDKARN